METIGNNKDFERAAKALHQDWTPEKVHHLIKVADDFVAASLASKVEAAPARAVPGWERGIATVTMTGCQLREALEFINPNGPSDELQADDELTFGVVQHADDDGKVTTGLCCWNDDTDGVYPLHGEPTSLAQRAASIEAQPVARVTTGGEFGPGLAFLANGKDKPRPGTLLFTNLPTQPDSGRDAARLDLLEAMANEPEGILLHDGGDFTGRRGFGLRRIGRTLREAIDATMATQPKKDN